MALDRGGAASTEKVLTVKGKQEMKSVVFALFAGMVGCAFVQPVSAAEPARYSEKVLHSFGSSLSDGLEPYASVIDVKGTLYGTTYYGGNSGNGTVFALDLNTGAEKVLHSFNGYPDANPEDGVIAVKGTLYGTTSGGGCSAGAEFALDPTLYRTPSGDDCSSGTVFALDPNTDAEKTVYSFCSRPNCADGAGPDASLIKVNESLFGTTVGGGRTGCGAGCGTVFSLDRNTGVEKVLYSFCSELNCADGRWPTAGLIDVNGTLYGTAANGGVPGCAENVGCGTVFSIDPKTGTEKTLYTFCSQQNCADGENPYASLIAVNGMLYGTTEFGGVPGCGSLGCGTVFSIDPNTGTEKVLYSFCRQPNCADGGNPQANLIDVNGMLYGTAGEGGGTGCNGFGCGTVFSIDPNSGAEMVLYSFAGGTDGATPVASLIDVNGTLYGTTWEGGGTGCNGFGCGTVFVLKKKR